MTMPFNHDGPVKVSEADFDTYKSLFGDNKPNTASLIKLWACEQYSDGTRRLAIRDALRPTYGIAPNEHAYHRIMSNFGHLRNLLFGDNNHPLLNIGLEYRPKLIGEIASEFIYVLQNNCFVERPRDQYNIDTFISCLISIVDENTGRTLIPYHSFWKNGPFYPVHTQMMLCNIVDPAIPAWLRAELWEKLKTALSSEIEHCKKLLASVPTEQKPSEPDTPAVDICNNHRSPIEFLQNVSRFIASYSTDSSEKDFAPLTPIIDYLEENLPAELAYSRNGEMIKIAPRLPDIETAYNYARRHVLNKREKTLNTMTSDWLRFFYWLRGLATHNHPKDIDLITEIDRCLKEIATTPK